jgi:hypothetical protein
MVSSWISDHDWDVSMGAPSSVSEAPTERYVRNRASWLASRPTE